MTNRTAQFNQIYEQLDDHTSFIRDLIEINQSVLQRLEKLENTENRCIHSCAICDYEYQK